jgi:hypothetical protein
MNDNKTAKKEFLEITKNYKVIAAKLSFDTHFDDDIENEFKLKPLYSKEEYQDFLKFLDVNYNSSYGSQKLFGIIYCEDDVWIDRGEYDGAEWYVVHQYPNLRDNFDKSDVLKYERSLKLKKIEKEDDKI